MPSEQTVPPRPHGLPFVFTMVVINMLGVGIAWPILPKLVQELSGGTISEAAYSYALITVSFALAQFIFAPLMGAISDRHGRRPIMLLAALGLSVDHLLVAVAPSIAFLVLLRVIGGIFGATIATANAYVTDISTPETRARNFGLIGAAFGVGFVAGPLLGGVLGAMDVRYPFFAASVLAFGQFVYGYFFLPESLPEEKRTPLKLTSANPLGGLLQLRRFSVIIPLLLAFFISAIFQRGLEASWVLYTDFRYGWDIRAASWSLAYVGLTSAITQAVLVRAVVPRLGETRTVVCGLALAGVTGLFFSFTGSGLAAIPLIGLYVIGYDLAGPPLRSIISAPVPPGEQGLLQGVMGSLNGLAVIIGPFFASLVLADIAGPAPFLPLPGIWFLAGAIVLMSCSVTVALLARRAVGAPAAHGGA